MKSLVFFSSFLSIFFLCRAAGPDKCPDVVLPKWDDFDYLKTQLGTWYLTHMTNFVIGKDIDESIGCTNKIIEITNDFKSYNFITMGFPQLKDVTRFNLSANVEFNQADKRNYTLQFSGEVDWRIGPIYVLEGDTKQYTLHWQCFLLNGKLIENFLVYSRTPELSNGIVEDLRSKLKTYVPKSRGRLEALVRCTKK